LPETKLIVLLRNPVDRAWSHYHMAVRQGHERLGFEEALEQEPERLAGAVERMLADEHHRSRRHQNFSYLSRGIYVDQLRTWTSYFPRERLLVLCSEDLYADPLGTTNRAVAFLGLQPWDGWESHRHNNGRVDPMPEDTRRRLEEHFRESNARLREFLGAEGTRFRWS
jgi:hypothetical protein